MSGRIICSAAGLREEAASRLMGGDAGCSITPDQLEPVAARVAPKKPPRNSIWLGAMHETARRHDDSVRATVLPDTGTTISSTLGTA